MAVEEKKGVIEVKPVEAPEKEEAQKPEEPVAKEDGKVKKVIKKALKPLALFAGLTLMYMLGKRSGADDSDDCVCDADYVEVSSEEIGSDE